MARSPGFLALRDRILELSRLRASDRLLDIGAGTGLLALAAAPRVERVFALDVSRAMCGHLERKLSRLGVDNAEVVVNSATALPLADGGVDVVVSNYCFHHLRDREKARALAQIRRVLRPGGRLVFADVMFRISVVKQRDRAVIALFVRRMIRHGPSGLLRLMRNVTRMLAGRWEHPASVEWWRNALLDAGFVDVDVQALAHEGGIAVARKPE
jgi:ubiquinone/menaquinone biosynthesis C-methylase UbiE